MSDIINELIPSMLAIETLSYVEDGTELFENPRAIAPMY